MYEADLIYCQKYDKEETITTYYTKSCRPLNNVAGHMYQKVDL